jgi:hypothetical protein
VTSLPPPYEPWRPPEVPPPPTWPPAADDGPRRSGNGLLIGIVAVVVLFLCGGIVAAGFAITSLRSASPSSSVPSTPGPSRSWPASTPGLEAATATVTGGPETSFHLPVGTAAQFTDQDGTWTVALLGVAWIDDCADMLGEPGRVVVLDIQYEVLDGAVSIIPINDFRYVPAGGSASPPSLFAGCAEPSLSYTVISAGAVSRGKVAFSVPSGAGGELTYGQFFQPTASWAVSER